MLSISWSVLLRLLILHSLSLSPLPISIPFHSSDSYLLSARSLLLSPLAWVGGGGGGRGDCSQNVALLGLLRCQRRRSEMMLFIYSPGCCSSFSRFFPRGGETLNWNAGNSCEDLSFFLSPPFAQAAAAEERKKDLRRNFLHSFNVSPPRKKTRKKNSIQANK